MKEKKLKVVWLCHFVNDELNDYFGIQLDELSRWMDAFSLLSVVTAVWIFMSWRPTIGQMKILKFGFGGLHIICTNIICEYPEINIV